VHRILWHLDFHQASLKVLDAQGCWYTPLACAILDDRSRVCCHLQWYGAETAQNLVHALTQALLKRGLPRALMTDNGAAMLAEETREGLARLGVAHQTTLPYSAYQYVAPENMWPPAWVGPFPETDGTGRPHKIFSYSFRKNSIR
jgi:putative transposase